MKLGSVCLWTGWMCVCGCLYKNICWVYLYCILLTAVFCCVVLLCMRHAPKPTAHESQCSSLFPLPLPSPFSLTPSNRFIVVPFSLQSWHIYLFAHAEFVVLMLKFMMMPHTDTHATAWIHPEQACSLSRLHTHALHLSLSLFHSHRARIICKSFWFLCFTSCKKKELIF